jgi:hypothetical protein
MAEPGKLATVTRAERTLWKGRGDNKLVLMKSAARFGRTHQGPKFAVAMSENMRLFAATIRTN